MKKILSLILIFIISVALFGVTVVVDGGDQNYPVGGNGVSAGNYNDEYYASSAPAQTYAGNIASNAVGSYSDINYNGVFPEDGIRNGTNNNSEEQIIVELKSLYDADTKWKSNKYEIQIP